MLSRFLLFSLFFIVFMVRGQFTGCPVDAGPDDSTNCSVSCINLTASFFDVGETTDYEVYSISHSPPIEYDELGGTPISVGIDDIWSGVINLPFDFCFYGQTYNTCVVGANGAIDFGSSNAVNFHPWEFTGICPSPALTIGGDIFGVYHDIDPGVAGTIRYYVLGNAPCRTLVVCYHDLPHFDCNYLTSTHMIVLYETTNIIDVYIENKPTCIDWNNGFAVVGIQNDTGLQGVAAPGRNTGAWTVTTPEGWRFMPNGAPIYTLEWFEGATSLGSNPQINVCPTETATYTAEVTYTACNGSTIVVSDDVTVFNHKQLCDIHVPNVLSLAEGSENSLWYVEGKGIDTFNVTITNRWGNVVYTCKNSEAQCFWDGRAENDAFVQPGTYYYLIEAKTMNGEGVIKSGFIHVVN